MDMYCFGQDQLHSDSHKQYKFKNIKDWYNEDCLDWAMDTEREIGIPFTSWTSIDGFRLLTGRDLLRYNVSDFKRVVNEQYGPLFFRAFRNLLKDRREEKATVKGVAEAFNPTPFSDFDSEYPIRAVPDVEFSEFETPQASYGNVFCDVPYFDSSLDNTYKSESCSRTYFTQSPALSGGSVVFENFSNIDQSMDFVSGSSGLTTGEPSYDMGAYASPIPDFNSLMIQDNSVNGDFDGDLDITELDHSFREESFSYLDELVHKSHQPQDLDLSSPVNLSLSVDLSTDLDSPLEKSMLKKITTGKRGNRVRHPQSWEFLVRLLLNPKSNPSLIKWEDKENGIFRLVQKEEIAKLWGKRSQKHKDEPLAYDNFARILRYHYKSKILLPVSDKHLVYKLGDQILMSLRAEGLI